MEPSNSDSTTIRVPKRAYQACIRCRRRKARCILDGPADGPNVTCLRCKRERKHCIFTAERSQAHLTPSSQPPSQPQTQPQLQSQSTYRSIEDPFRPSAASSPLGGLPDRVSNAVVSNQSDALRLLFEAAESYNAHDGTGRSTGPDENRVGAVVEAPLGQWLSPTYQLVQCSLDSLRALGRLKFVRKRWLTAEEVATYIELFYKNMCSFSPILDGFYRDPAHFNELVANEPVLCTVILTLSTRYHHLTGSGWLSRNYFLHNRLWRYCQSLLQRVIWGQEKGTSTSMRGLGTIEGLLLMIDWHARSLHMPPDIEAWDSDDDNIQETELNKFSQIPNRWLEGVVEPMRRSDRMSWSLVQAAVGIAQELEVFDDTQDEVATDDASATLKAYTAQRRRRLRILLYVYMNQLALRVGYSSLIPQALLSIKPNDLKLTPTQCHPDWLHLMSLQVDLTRLMRTSADLLFPSRAVTRDLSQTGSYQRILEHFQPMLEGWWEKYSSFQVQGPFRDLLAIDFMYLKTYVYSLALQAVAERTMNSKVMQGLPNELLFMISNVTAKDYEYIQNVIDSSKAVLQAIIGMEWTEKLRFLPVRVYVRIISACIFLLKALALGVPMEELNASLGLIDQAAGVLRRNIVDDLHLAGVFASLLETYTKGFRERFISIPALARGDGRVGMGSLSSTTGGEDPLAGQVPLDDALGLDQEWLAHPFDSSVAPFGLGVTQPICGFDDELNLLWNTGA
ncbi:hypothetical protein N7510_004135 [Penicillium lagena]|uniref:uncharacterized protein n=1 Tax=Penicillium lagena TaxID=94218 RepID=UPI002541A23B|nr:uncharacterized protein N7510_004135 [Penicillium lagena]KAJ5620151.1 hypothetical protein N7510_004135 [Penicillium lagena]